ncbi:MAG: hypothetical protein ABH833_04630 [Parcubacteria group bacterium]
MADLPKSDDLPESYFVGQEYLEEGSSDSVRIDFSFFTSAVIEPFKFFVQKNKVEGLQTGGVLTVSFKTELPKKLIDDLAWGKGNSSAYVLGYIYKHLPMVNQELIKQRYLSGHFLITSFSMLDIFSIKVSNLDKDKADEIISVPWPPTFDKFPPAQNLRGEQLETYLMDYIDAGNEYLRGDYNHCIRSTITSVENAFHFYGLDRASPTGWKRHIPFLKETSFNSTILCHVYRSDNQGLEAVGSNLLFLYKLRNRIVHDKLRIRFENGWICRRGLATLNYLYQFLDKGGKISDYIMSMEGQLMMLENELKGSTIERLRASKESTKEPTDPEYIIDSDEKLNKWMFGNLKITKREQSIVLNNKIPPNFYKR